MATVHYLAALFFIIICCRADNYNYVAEVTKGYISSLDNLDTSKEFYIPDQQCSGAFDLSMLSNCPTVRALYIKVSDQLTPTLEMNNNLTTVNIYRQKFFHDKCNGRAPVMVKAACLNLNKGN